MKKQKVYHFVYKTTNLINQKIYIGKHSTKNLEDGYLGSGIHLSHSIKKYGEENFKREILKMLETEQEAYDYEAELVTKEFILQEDNYNHKLGGKGGFLGMISVVDKNGNFSSVFKDDPRYLSGEVIHINSGKESSIKGKEAYYNGVTTRFFSKEDTIPDLYEKGNGSFLERHLYSNGKEIKYLKDEESEEGFFKIKGTAPNKDKDKYTNGIVDIYFAKGAEIPEGFEKGSCLVPGTFEKFAYTNGIDIKYFVENDPNILKDFYKGTCQVWVNKGKQLYTDGTKNVYFNKDEVPKEFILGNTRDKKEVYTNGERDIRLTEQAEIPEGFYKGVSTGVIGKHVYTDGKRNKLFSDEDLIPQNFKRGKAKATTQGKTGFTNQRENIFIDLSITPIPEGFIKGMTRKKDFITS